nr:DUF2474 family protein [Cupriavidus taiwanensis]
MGQQRERVGRQLAWLVVLWLAGIATVGAVAGVMRLLMRLAGLVP